jgi:hypothetical protein
MGKQLLGPNTARRKHSVASKRATTFVGSGDASVIWTLSCGPSTVIPSGLFGLSLRWSLVQSTEAEKQMKHSGRSRRTDRQHWTAGNHPVNNTLRSRCGINIYQPSCD